MIRAFVSAVFVASIFLTFSMCFAQEESHFRKLELQLVEANQRLKQERLLLDKRLDGQLDKTGQRLESNESIDLAIEKTIALRAKMEEALASYDSDRDVVKGSSLERYSPEQMKEARKKFTTETWNIRISFAEQLRKSSQFGKAIEQLETTLGEMEAIYGPDHSFPVNLAPRLKTEKWLYAASESELELFRKTVADRKEAGKLFREKSYLKAVEKWKTALQDLESLGFTDSVAYGESLANIAEAYLNLDKVEMSQNMFKLSLIHI